MDYLQEIKRFHAQYIQPYTSSPVGCTEQDIAALEQQVGFALPAAYMQYLLWMGRDYDGIFRGSDWFIDHVLERTAWLPELLAENHISTPLPHHYLVFFGHQGYSMAWFELPKQHENPPAYIFAEGAGMTAPHVAGTFTDVLFEDMRGLAPLLGTNRR
jgi:hypothetical protein